MRLLLGLLLLPFGATWAADEAAKAPLVIELFTSKFCPNCPAVEHHFAKETPKNANWLLLQQHVDYWDRGPQKDPYGFADATQRQYDYSNILGRRAGEVFTPMPILNGLFVSPPPLFLNWAKAEGKAFAVTAPTLLTPALNADGALELTLPKGAIEAVVMGVEPMTADNTLRVRAIVPMDVAGSTAKLHKALLPKTAEWVVLAQASGPGALIGFGRLRAVQ